MTGLSDEAHSPSPPRTIDLVRVQDAESRVSAPAPGRDAGARNHNDKTGAGSRKRTEVALQAPPAHAWTSTRGPSERPRYLAFYLPQYHTIPENDEWWGAGFTEWTNVVNGRPLFRGHAQPDLPGDLGFYDLRVPETRAAQARLAADHGIDAFCYYHYWFNGRRLLEKPFEAVLHSGEPSAPFCLCWANEDWTRRWDGRSGEVLLGQRHCEEDDLAHIRSLLPAFADARYVRVDGRPLFLVYRSSRLPDPQRTTDLWRTEAARAGLPGLYLVVVESFPDEIRDPGEMGFDAAVGFQPRWDLLTYPRRQRLPRSIGGRLRVLKGESALPRCYRMPYAELVRNSLGLERSDYRRFPGVLVAWDNSPRRRREAIVMTGSTPELYAEWLRAVSTRGDDGLVFVTAWNEWGEGAHLEPSQDWGRAYLEAHRDVVRSLQ